MLSGFELYPRWVPLFKFYLFVLMTLIASIITFSKKKNPKIKCYPRHGTLAIDMEPSTLDPRQKDRLEESWLYIWLHMYWTHCSIHCMTSPIKWNRKRFDPARFLWWEHYCDLDYHISPDPQVYLDVSAQLCNISGQQGAYRGKAYTGLDTCSGYSIFNFWADTW